MVVETDSIVGAGPGADNLLVPSASTARSTDQAVRDRLQGSFAWLATEFDALHVDPERLKSWRARPTDFGFYYDLASALHHDPQNALSAENVQISERLAQSIQNSDETSKAPQLAVKSLGPGHYDDMEVACLIRWFDLEPENSMALLPLNDAEFKAASATLARAIAFLEQSAPDFFHELNALTAEIVFAKPGPGAKLNFGGASSFVLWGAMALNAHAHRNWWEYLPRLVHEYSHNLLFGLAIDGALVLNDPTEKHCSPLRQTPRPVDGIYHACYVSAREVIAMDAILAALPGLDIGEDAETVEKYCRSIAERSSAAFEDCLTVLNAHARLTDLGARILEDAATVMNAR